MKPQERGLRRQLLTILFAVFSVFLQLPGGAQAAGITGKVTDAATSSAVPNILIGIFDTSNKYVNSGKTGADGLYAISGLLAGDYKVVFVTSGTEYIKQWHNNKQTFTAADPVSLADPNASLDLGETKLVKGAKISGTVKDAVSMALISNVTVQAFAAADPAIWVSGTTDAAGAYSIVGLMPGNYKVRFRAFGTEYITEWHNDKADETAADVVAVPAEGLTINAELSLGGKISGKVTVLETGLPLASAWINVYDAGNVLRGNAKTGADGSYVVGGLSAGSYKVEFFERTANNAGAGVTASLNSVAANSTNVNMAFNGASIDGFVTKDIGGTLDGVIVKAYNSSGAVEAASTATGTDGGYSIKGLRRGAYKLHFQAFGTGYVSEWYNDKAALSAADPVTITSLADALTGKDAALASGGTVAGTVTDQDGTPVAEGLVQVYDSGTASTVIGIAKTGSNGSYTVTGLPAGGTVKVRFFKYAGADNSGAGPTKWYNNKSDFNSADVVTVNGTGIDAVLDPAALLVPVNMLLLRKRCLDAAGVPVHCNCFTADGVPAYCSN